MWSLITGEIYSEGNVGELHRLTGWEPHKILYFGDQMLADLAEPVMNQGWHTGLTLLLFTFLSFLVLSLLFLIIRDSSLWTFFRFFNYLLLLLLLQIFLTIKSPKTGTEPPPPHYKIISCRSYSAGAFWGDKDPQLPRLSTQEPYSDRAQLSNLFNAVPSTCWRGCGVCR